jgi:succinoglycan biosynthesis protein ExoM
MRPLMLAHCLDAIGAQVVQAGVEVCIVVVDNEPSPNNRRCVQEFAARCRFPVHYVHEPRRGIPQARNAVLKTCQRLGVDWIAFTDDDCRVGSTWLASLMDAATRYSADVVYGRREFVLPLPSPFWAAPPDQGCYVEGQRLPYAATHNVLFAAWLIRHDAQTGLQFDEGLAHGEDTDFFHRAAQRGARIVYAHEPVVFETVTHRRATLNYQARRAYHHAASRSHFHRRYRGIAGAAQKFAVRCLFHAPVAVLRLLTAPLVWPFSEPAFKDLILKGTARLAGTAGAAAGLFGYDGNPYETIDGY